MSEKITNVNQVKDTDSLIRFMESKDDNNKISEQEFQIIISTKSVRFTLSLALKMISKTGMLNAKNDYIFRIDFSKFEGRFCGDAGNGKLVDCRYLESKLRDENDNKDDYDTKKRKYFMLIYMFAQSLERKNLGYLDEEQYQEIVDTIARSLDIGNDNKYAQHIVKIFGANTIKKDFLDKILDKYKGPTDKEFVGNVFRTYGDKFDTDGLKKIFGDNGEKIDFDIDLINPESELSLYQICLKCDGQIDDTIADKIISKLKKGSFKLTEDQKNAIKDKLSEGKKTIFDNKLTELSFTDIFKIDDLINSFKDKDKEKKDWANFKSAVEELNKNMCADFDTALKVFELCLDVYVTDKKVNEKNEKLKLAGLDPFQELKGLKINYYNSDSPKEIYDAFIKSIKESDKKLTTDKLKFIAFERKCGNVYFDSDELMSNLTAKLLKSEMESSAEEDKKDKVDDKFLYWLGVVFGENKINKEIAKACTEKFDGQFNQFTFAKFANSLENSVIDKDMAQKLFYKGDNNCTFEVLNGPQIMLGINEDNYKNAKEKFDTEGLKIFDNTIEAKRKFEYEDTSKYVDFIFSDDIENYYDAEEKATADSKKFEGLAKYLNGLGNNKNDAASEFFSRMCNELEELAQNVEKAKEKKDGGGTIDVEKEKNKLHYCIDLYPNLDAKQKEKWHKDVKNADKVSLVGIVWQFIKTVAKMALYLPSFSEIREEGHEEWEQGLEKTRIKSNVFDTIRKAENIAKKAGTKYKTPDK